MSVGDTSSPIIQNHPSLSPLSCHFTVSLTQLRKTVWAHFPSTHLSLNWLTVDVLFAEFCPKCFLYIIHSSYLPTCGYSYHHSYLVSKGAQVKAITLQGWACLHLAGIPLGQPSWECLSSSVSYTSDSSPLLIHIRGGDDPRAWRPATHKSDCGWALDF